MLISRQPVTRMETRRRQPAHGGNGRRIVVCFRAARSRRRERSASIVRTIFQPTLQYVLGEDDMPASVGVSKPGLSFVLYACCDLKSINTTSGVASLYAKRHVNKDDDADESLHAILYPHLTKSYKTHGKRLRNRDVLKRPLRSPTSAANNASSRRSSLPESNGDVSKAKDDSNENRKSSVDQVNGNIAKGRGNRNSTS